MYKKKRKKIIAHVTSIVKIWRKKIDKRSWMSEVSPQCKPYHEVKKYNRQWQMTLMANS